MCLFYSGCMPKIQEDSGTILNVYREIRIGSEDGTTVVQFEDGRIQKYRGRLGKIGQKIKVPHYAEVE